MLIGLRLSTGRSRPQSLYIERPSVFADLKPFDRNQAAITGPKASRTGLNDDQRKLSQGAQRTAQAGTKGSSRIMKLKPVLCAFAAVSVATFSQVSVAQKTYTPAQLRSMVQSGNYPKQGSVATQTKEMDYTSCIVSLESVVSSVKPEYPTITVVNTNLMRVEKVWTNDRRRYRFL
jgi:hypothetical protein